MAGFRGHITTSSLLGVGYGTGAVLACGFTPTQGVLAGCLTAVGGLIPDLDLQSSTPSRELFGLTAALAPLVMMPRLIQWGGSHEAAMVLAVLLYLAIRYCGASIFGKFSVHRGMFHSIPALVISAELMFLGFQSDLVLVKLLMAGGIGLGFLSHLILDEIYSVQLTGAGVRLAKSAGSAMKLFGSSTAANMVAYLLLCVVSYGVLIDGGWVERPTSGVQHRIIRQAEEAMNVLRR